MDCFRLRSSSCGGQVAALAMTKEHTSAFPRRDSPGFALIFTPMKIRGRRERRVPDAPMARVQKNAHGVTTGSPEITRRSLRNGFNGLFRALPGDEFVLPPSSAD